MGHRRRIALPEGATEVTPVLWTASALADVRSIRTYVQTFNPGAAKKLAETLIAAGTSLSMFPNRGRPVGDNLRELTVIYPYIIRYEADGERMIILRVRHGMRQE